MQEALALAQGVLDAQYNFDRARLKVNIINTNRSENQNSSEIIAVYIEAKKVYINAYEKCRQNCYCGSEVAQRLNNMRSLGLIS